MVPPFFWAVECGFLFLRFVRYKGLGSFREFDFYTLVQEIEIALVMWYLM